jgi:hypothetical protein
MPSLIKYQVEGLKKDSNEEGESQPSTSLLGSTNTSAALGSNEHVTIPSCSSWLFAWVFAWIFAHFFLTQFPTLSSPLLPSLLSFLLLSSLFFLFQYWGLNSGHLMGSTA